MIEKIPPTPLSIKGEVKKRHLPIEASSMPFNQEGDSSLSIKGEVKKRHLPIEASSMPFNQEGDSSLSIKSGEMCFSTKGVTPPFQ
ncbi:MAG: hypothetical protein C0392_12835 [Syntrophus sp. (in: bacteria)]|nr:hypothetical protein [Syntrophus sp. (in: bacteria)]